MTVSASLAREVLGRKTLDELLDYWRRRADYPVEVQRVLRELLLERGETVEPAPDLDAPIIEPPAPEVEPVRQAEPWLLTIPTARFIGLSLVSFSMFVIYWMYRNWAVLKQRDRLDIWPLPRALFGVFFCHRLLHTIYEDEYGRNAARPEFRPDLLATIWVVLVVTGNVVARFSDFSLLVIALALASYLCLLPVQAYINRVYAVMEPDRRLDGWTREQGVFAMGGALLWLLLLRVPA